MSYYIDEDGQESGSSDFKREVEVMCHRCYGLGIDEDDLDCMYCDGMGSNITRY